MLFLIIETFISRSLFVRCLAKIFFFFNLANFVLTQHKMCSAISRCGESWESAGERDDLVVCFLPQKVNVCFAFA